MGTIADVEPFLAQDGTSDETNAQNIFHYLGTNETMQNVLGSIVQVWRNFQKNLGVKNFENLNFCVLFISDLGEIYHRGKEQHTAEPAYSRHQGNKEYCLLKEKSTITGIE